MKRLVKSLCKSTFLGLGVIFIFAACKERASRSPADAAQPSDLKRKKFYLIVPLKGHPALQIAQIAFKEGCKDFKYDSEVLGTEGWDVAGTIFFGRAGYGEGGCGRDGRSRVETRPSIIRRKSWKGRHPHHSAALSTCGRLDSGGHRHHWL